MLLNTITFSFNQFSYNRMSTVGCTEVMNRRSYVDERKLTSHTEEAAHYPWAITSIKRELLF